MAITPAEKARLTKAFETFGPERVARGLRSTGHTWDDCFLACAAAGELAAFAPGLRQHCRMQRIAALEPGSNPWSTACGIETRPRFGPWPPEWLEDHPAVLVTSLSARRRTPPGSLGFPGARRVSALGKGPEVVAWIAVMWLVVRPLGRYRPRAGVTRAEKALLTEGFEWLGSVRVAAGLRATGHEWHDCFLATATAENGRPANWVARIRG